MSIIMMVSENASTDEMLGAYCPLRYADQRIMVKETHAGLCISEHEHNGYDDSNFYMTVWNPEKGEPESIMFATTRFWTYPCYASFVDATLEVMAAYSNWKKNEERRRQVMAKLENRRQLREYAHNWGVTMFQARKLVNVISRGYLPSMDRLLKTKKSRSGFRKSLADQVRAWLSSDNGYNRPLSPKQMDYL